MTEWNWLFSAGEPPATSSGEVLVLRTRHWPPCVRAGPWWTWDVASVPAQQC